LKEQFEFLIAVRDKLTETMNVVRKMRESLRSEKEEILAEARRRKQVHDTVATELREAFRVLKKERLVQGLSLADMRERTGMGRSAISRLENDENANPTIETLTRYAQALGKDLSITLRDNGEQA
jgi:DNA-binding phage protein